MGLVPVKAVEQQAADELYGLPRSDFTKARDDLARRLAKLSVAPGALVGGCYTPTMCRTAGDPLRPNHKAHGMRAPR
jgi:hypothetical protein